MPRIRTIKPEFWTDEKVVNLDYVDRLLFIGLWCYCDDQGFIDDRPKQIKMRIFPGDDIDVTACLARLVEEGMLEAFESVEGPVLHVRNWGRHQKINRPSKPRFPDEDMLGRPLTPEEYMSTHGVLSEDSVSTHWGKEGKEGKERKGKEGKGKDLIPAPKSRNIPEPEGFEEFYRTYPRHMKRADAANAYKQALRTVDPQTILAGATRFAADPNLPEKSFIPYPATWLRAQSWDDEPLPARMESLSRSDQNFIADMQRIQQLEAEERFLAIEGGAQ